MIVSMLPVWAPDTAYGKGPEDLTVNLDGTVIGNKTVQAENAFRNFNVNGTGFASSPGFIQTEQDKDIKIYSNGTMTADDKASVTFEINVLDNPLLKAMAAGGDTEIVVGWDLLKLYEKKVLGVVVSTSVTTANFFVDGENILSGHSGGGTIGHKEETATIRPDSTIKIQVWLEDGEARAEGIFIKFQDKVAPTIKDYIFTSTGTERDNTKIGEKELFLKAGERMELTYPFSEPVKPSGDTFSLTTHYLFTNPAKTGLPGAGQNQGMRLPSSTDWTQFTDKLAYSYSPTPLHHSGNLPIKNGGELTDIPTEGGLNQSSLLEKIKAADFHDAAGNWLDTSNFGQRASTESSSHMSGKAINPFDETVDSGNVISNNDGYRVIVDAVPPKYTFAANGIQPEIVTGSTLNGGDVIDFKVQLTEDTIVKAGLNADNLILHFNNGMKARYIKGENTDTWTFRAEVTDQDVDVALLKVIALSHESRAAQGYPDKGVIQDYAGNLLMDAAHTNKSAEPVPTDPSQQIPNTKIDWAKLSIDNQDPEFSYSYDSDGATDAVYGKKGKITIDANDPSVTAPPLDPDEAGFVRPSRGIYRPLNMTGGTGGNSPGVGLVFYYWSQDSGNPLAGKEEDKFAAVKRYSLTGLQPSDGLYPGELEKLKFMVANNKTNLLSPPPEAFVSDASGPWYLHTWTADMTWDTARELMQYEKKKVFETNNAVQYTAWKNEYLASHPGASAADAEFYASGKALVAVGEYENLAMWTPEDYKHDDSNWIYNKATLLLDNKAPVLTAEIIAGDKPEVKALITATDKHSGIDAANVQYQWVKEHEAPSSIGWTTVPADYIVSTQGHVFEDGTYDLYLQGADHAGNITAAQKSASATVNSSDKIEVSFSPTSTIFMKSQNVKLTITKVQVEAVAYAYSSSPVRPADSQFTPTVLAAVYGSGPVPNVPVVDSAAAPSVTSSVYAANTVTSAVYEHPTTVWVPADPALNGEQYLHIRVQEAGAQSYYFNQLYKFDNTAPAVTFNINGVNYAKPSHAVTVTATELQRPDDMKVSYQWVREDVPAPGDASPGWQTLPKDGKTTLDNSVLAAGETANFILYVYAIDGAGNAAITHTGTFRLSREDNSPVQVLQSDLIAFEGNETDGYKAVLQLELQNTTKHGFEYAISKDNGINWTNWMPYTNFVRTPVDAATPAQLQLKVKFRSPGGGESSPADVDTKAFNPAANILYGIASYNTMKPVGSGAVSLTISVPAGVKVKPSATDNLASPVHVKGNTYSIPQNGIYTFDLTDLTAPDRKARLLAVVINIDDTAPEGVIVYNITGPTSSNVTAELQTSEPVRVLNNEGSRRHSFKENGSFTFEFEDEAGNKNTATATVTNIDKTPPSVDIVATDKYGDNGSKTFKTIKDSQGNVILAEGVVLSVVKAANSTKDITVIQGENPVTMRDNGKVEFTVRDQNGNTTVVEKVISYIAPALETPEIVYEFVDENGQPLSPDKTVTVDGKTYAKGKVKVTLSGQVSAPNKIFLGTGPSIDKDNGNYLNQISGTDGRYSHSAIYSTNGLTKIAISDLLGQRIISPIEVTGLDNTAPELKLNRPVISVIRNQEGFNPYTDLGGYTVSDNLSAADHVTVTISDLDLTATGKKSVTYTVTDELGNSAAVTQSVVVLPDSGLMITGNGEVISSSLEEAVLFDTNNITFRVQGYDEMMVEGAKATNERATFSILYHSGLYREGQMKYIAEEISYEALTAQQFQVTFPKTGWYTIIVRTQEREREFASFFVGNKD
jgi:hypothetical protein